MSISFPTTTALVIFAIGRHFAVRRAERRHDLVDVDLINRDLTTVVKRRADQHQARNQVGTAQGYMKCDAGDRRRSIGAQFRIVGLYECGMNAPRRSQGAMAGRRGLA